MTARCPRLTLAGRTCKGSARRDSLTGDGRVCQKHYETEQQALYRACRQAGAHLSLDMPVIGTYECRYNASMRCAACNSSYGTAFYASAAEAAAQVLAHMADLLQ